MPKKFQPYKSCHCHACKRSQIFMSGTQSKRDWKKEVHRKFRRNWSILEYHVLRDMDYIDDRGFGYISGDRLW